MSMPIWFVNLLKKYFPNRFKIADLTNYPLIGTIIDAIIFNGDDIIYLPKDKIFINQAIHPENVMVPSAIIDNFIEKASHHWIMDHCICRESAHCTEYPQDIGCLFLGEAVLKINPQLGRLVSKREALEHVKRASEAGLFHMIGRDKLDTIWLGTGPGSKLLTICNCCPCCCLFKILPHLNADINLRVTRMPGVEVRILDSCAGCGSCTEGICFVNAIYLGEDGKAHITEDCRGCGHCLEVCPNDAIELRITNSTFIEDSITRLSAVIDI